MPNVVVEFQVELPAELQVEVFKARLLKLLRSEGIDLDDVELHVHSDDYIVSWKPKDLGDGPSAAQKGFFLKLKKQLADAARGDDEASAQARTMLLEIDALLGASQITKRTISSCIDAMKEAISDVGFARRQG